MKNPGLKLSEVFRNIDGHRESAGIIRSYSTNNTDIRQFALEGIDLSGRKRFIDLGCGFGFFTEALKNRIQPGSFITGIDCHPEYRETYLETCRYAGIDGDFDPNGVNVLRSMSLSGIDVVLSSYSIYFFPEILPSLSDLIHEGGMVIIITHASTHLRELTEIVMKIIHDTGFPEMDILPHDKLIDNFTAEKGYSMLEPYFRKISVRKYRNDLVFTEHSVADFLKYFSYKRTFFMPEQLSKDHDLYGRIEKGLVERFCSRDGCRITKDDAVFICEQPVKR